MARPNVLFLVHGVGEHRGGWSQLPKKTLRDAAAGYDCFPDTPDPLENEIEFVEIRYDDVFDLIFERFEGLTEQFKRVDPALVPAQLQGILSTLRDLDNAGARFAGDVLLYKLKLVSTTVLLRVMKQITDKVKDIGRDQDLQTIRFGILGHALGTTVVHDALHLLATTPVVPLDEFRAEVLGKLPELEEDLDTFGANPYGNGNFRFKAVYMVSNTSRLLSTTVDPYQSVVRPFDETFPQAVCDSYYNIDHKWDPISKVRPFRLEEAWGGNALGAAQVDVEHVYQENIHALDHYLMNPLVHAPIFLLLAPSFKKSHLREARRRVEEGEFKRWGPGFEPEEVRRALREKLEAALRERIGEDKIRKTQELLVQLKNLVEG